MTRRKTRARREDSRIRGRRSRRAAVTLELLLTLPVWLILLLATIEFGQLLSNMQQVSLASRVGAEEAAHTLSLANVTDVVDQQMATAGMTRCRVILEHNVGGGTNTATDGACINCPPPGGPFPSVDTNNDNVPDYTPEAVRVTVCVAGDQLAPNLLNACGIDISTWTISQTTTFRYEATSP